MKCSNCGNNIRNPINYCPYCREPLNVTAPSLKAGKASGRYRRRLWFLILILMSAAIAFYIYTNILAKHTNWHAGDLLGRIKGIFEKAGSYSARLAEKGTKSLPNSFNEPYAEIEFLLIKGGCFTMGDTFGDGDGDEKPAHEACVKDFYLSRLEITQQQWEMVMGKNPSSFKEKDGPVDNINLKDIHDFIDLIREKSPDTIFRLPTEAEWEYACRSGGKKEKWSGSSNPAEVSSIGWFGSNSEGKPHGVGTAKPNGLGLHDMSGNVWEWTIDEYSPDCYSSHAKDNPLCKGNTGNRVIRGGSWNLSERFARCSARRGADPYGKAHSLGFRLVAEVVEQQGKTRR